MKPFDTQLFIKTVCAVLLSWLLSATPGVAEKFRVVDNSMGPHRWPTTTYTAYCL